MRIPVREELLSEFARAKYERFGRGAVVIDEAGAISTPEGEKSGTTLAYLYEGGELFLQVGSRWPGRTKVAVDTYDPSKELVVIVLDRAGNLEAYLLPLRT